MGNTTHALHQLILQYHTYAIPFLKTIPTPVWHCFGKPKHSVHYVVKVLMDVVRTNKGI